GLLAGSGSIPAARVAAARTHGGVHGILAGRCEYNILGADARERALTGAPRVHAIAADAEAWIGSQVAAARTARFFRAVATPAAHAARESLLANQGAFGAQQRIGGFLEFRRCCL